MKLRRRRYNLLKETEIKTVQDVYSFQNLLEDFQHDTGYNITSTGKAGLLLLLNKKKLPVNCSFPGFFL